MKLKEIRLLNIKIYENEELIFEGKTEDISDNLKEREYKNIKFEGVDIVAEI